MDTYLSSEVYRHYRGWCRKQGAPANGCSFRFSASRYGKETWMSYPELGSIYKAACTKGMLYWAASFLKESATTVPGGDLRYRTILAFTRFQHLIDSHGPFLGESGTKDVVNVGRQALLLYQRLALWDKGQVQDSGCRNYKITPKFHAFLELTFYCESTGRNPRTPSCILQSFF